MSQLRIPICLDFSAPHFDSDYLESTRIIPELNTFRVKNQSLGLYFNQKLNLNLSNLLTVHPVAEIKGVTEKMFGFYQVEDKELTLFCLNEQDDSFLLNINFLKDFLNINLEEKSNTQD